MYVYVCVYSYVVCVRACVCVLKRDWKTYSKLRLLHIYNTWQLYICCTDGVYLNMYFTQRLLFFKNDWIRLIIEYIVIEHESKYKDIGFLENDFTISYIYFYNQFEIYREFLCIRDVYLIRDPKLNRTITLAHFNRRILR